MMNQSVLNLSSMMNQSMINLSNMMNQSMINLSNMMNQSMINLSNMMNQSVINGRRRNRLAKQRRSESRSRAAGEAMSGGAGMTAVRIEARFTCARENKKGRCLGANQYITGIWSFSSPRPPLAPFRLIHLASESRRSGSLYHLSVMDQQPQRELRFGDI